MNDIIIRKAELSDLPILLQFEQGIIAAERPFDPTLKPDPISYYDVEAMITATHVEVMVAELNGELIASGYARVQTPKIFLKHSQYAFMGFMYVVPAQRGKGVNKMIINALQQWANAQGITEMRLEVYDDNLAAIKAYERVGFKKHMVEMRMEANNND